MESIFIFGTTLLMLFFLELVLGIDNLIILTMLSKELPAEQQRSARMLGLFLALFFRLAALGLLFILAHMDNKLFSIDLLGYIISFSGRDIFLLFGGVFLLVKGITELMHIASPSVNIEKKVYSNYFSVVVQIVFIDLVFSLDSVIAAIGLTDNIIAIILSIIFAILGMLLLAESLSGILEKYDSLNIFAFQVVIFVGLSLVLEGLNIPLGKYTVLACLFFGLYLEITRIFITHR